MHDATTTIHVEARIIGKRRLTTPWDVSIPPELLRETAGAEYPFRLRDLIVYLVREEIHAFQQRREEHRLLHVLRPPEIAEAARQGKIALGGVGHLPPEQHHAQVDENVAVQVALQGFLDGLYLVFLDGQQQRDLDAPVQPQPTSTLLFLRLVALAGG